MADKNKAVGYYNKAAGLGDVEAMNCLGIMYENGLGLDNQQALSHIGGSSDPDLMKRSVSRGSLGDKFASGYMSNSSGYNINSNRSHGANSKSSEEPI